MTDRELSLSVLITMCITAVLVVFIVFSFKSCANTDNQIRECIQAGGRPNDCKCTYAAIPGPSCQK